MPVLTKLTNTVVTDQQAKEHITHFNKIQCEKKIFENNFTANKCSILIELSNK